MKIIAVGTRYATSPGTHGRLELRVGVSYDRRRKLLLLHAVGTDENKLAVLDTGADTVRAKERFTEQAAREEAGRLLTGFHSAFYSDLVSPDRTNCLAPSSSPHHPASDFEVVAVETLGGGP